MLKTIILSVSVVAAAGLLGYQIASIRTGDRYVTVRGAAELPVVADKATWNLGLTATGNELHTAQTQLEGDIAKLSTFLTSNGIPAADIERAPVSVQDASANQYNQYNGPRFSISGGLVVRTASLTEIRKAQQSLYRVLADGVVLTNSWGPNYGFSKLNDYKAQLVSEATAAARVAAEQFAKDSGESIGGIRRASQGSVQILGRDDFTGESEQQDKILRVVTTVDYTLN